MILDYYNIKSTCCRSRFIYVEVNENMSKYMPKAYEMITDGPCSLEKKWNKKNVFSYSRRDKTNLKEEVLKMIREFTPYARIRYMF